MKVYLETIFATMNQQNVLYCCLQRDITDDSSDPDDIVIRTIESDKDSIPKVVPGRYLSHSTSWRHEVGKIIITYIIFSDHINFQDLHTSSIPIAELEITKGNHVRPRPTNISENNVVSHGLRHLGFLLRTKDSSTYYKVLSFDSISFLKQIYITLAGEITEQSCS